MNEKEKEMFDARIERAIEQLWIHPWNGDGKKAKELLEEVAKEGNGDAYYFLGRCYLGEAFIMPKFGFEENDEFGMECFNKSIELGSAIGMFATRRLSGFKPRSGKYIHPPYGSVKEVWEAVCALAEQGQTFCQYLVGNAYYYGDCIELMEIPEDRVDLTVIQVFQMKAIELFEKAIEKGFTMPISNLIDIISTGDYGIEENPKRVQELIEIGAKYQHPYYEFKYATQLEDTDVQTAVMYYERSILHGETKAYYYLGDLYGEGKKIPRDLNKAMYYYKKGLEVNENSAGCNNGLGEIYFKGGDGIQPDYEKAVKCFKRARSQDSTWCSSMLGQCYLKGLGTEVDYEAARNEFMQNPTEELSAVGLGEIYCYGLGVKAKPFTALKTYILPNMNNERAKELCKEYKTGKIDGTKGKIYFVILENYYYIKKELGNMFDL